MHSRRVSSLYTSGTRRVTPSVLSHERGNHYLHAKTLYFIVLLVVTCRQE
jgi:hypothetical protein